MRRYKTGTTPTGNLSQTQRWLRRELGEVEQAIESIRQQFILGVGYGSIGHGGPTAGADIGVTWQDYDLNDTQRIPPVKTTYDLGAGTIAIDQLGVWQFSVYIALDHNSLAGSSRRLDMRLADDITGAVTDPLTQTVGRDATSTALSFDFLVPVAGNGAAILPQLSSVNTFSSVIYQASMMSASMVSPYLVGEDEVSLSTMRVPV